MSAASSAPPPPPPPDGQADPNGERAAGPFTKFVLITGGTVSGLGKGTATAALGVTLRSHGLRVTAVKIDTYMNIDAGTMSPFERGEVYVLDDGGEVDLDLGDYERFLDVSLTSAHSLTSGKIFEQVLKRERTGHYLGKTVHMVPAVTDAIQDWIVDVARRPVESTGLPPEVCLLELGGTVGDLDTAMYLEALQQLMFKVGTENFCVVHLGLVPVMGASVEQKTKPCQHSARKLREVGLAPDLLLCRTEQPLEEATRRKLSVACQVPLGGIISLHDVSNIYRVPLLFAEQGVGSYVVRHLRMPCESTLAPVLSLPDTIAGAASVQAAQEARLGDWRLLADRVDMCSEEVVIAIVGKYTGRHDACVSTIKALKHAAVESGLHLAVEWVESADLEPNAQVMDSRRHDAAWWKLKSAHGVVVPGGATDRNVEGKVRALQYCRTSNTPLLGIAAGMHLAVVEFARSELGWEGANSTEFEESTPHPVAIFMPEASAAVAGGSMRLGARSTVIKDEDSLAFRLYGGRPAVQERHRQRYEVNSQCVPALEARGLRFTGQDERGHRMQICELRGHPFYLGTAFFPEFRSRPSAPSPPVLGLVLAAARRLDRRLQQDGGLLRPGAGLNRS